MQTKGTQMDYGDPIYTGPKMTMLEARTYRVMQGDGYLESSGFDENELFNPDDPEGAGLLQGYRSMKRKGFFRVKPGYFTGPRGSVPVIVPVLPQVTRAYEDWYTRIGHKQDR